MDATYKDTMTEQIGGNPFVDDYEKADLIDVLKMFSESDLKSMAEGDKYRFFYKSSQNEISEQMKERMPQTVRARIQTQVNRLARAGAKSENSFIRENFSATYTRGGHKYVDGVRKY